MSWLRLKWGGIHCQFSNPLQLNLPCLYMEIEVPQPNGTTNMVLQLPEILQNEQGFPPLLSKTSGLVDDPFLPHYLFAEELVHTSIPRWRWDPILEWEKQGIYSENSICSAPLCLCSALGLSSSPSFLSTQRFVGSLQCFNSLNLLLSGVLPFITKSKRSAHKGVFGWYSLP
ncbi:hypothetical protein VNO80_26896 [Phaseolus coccineus]|uniref:Uncharacterized protein n=1 Tax=Phaseolus coccineus TaxID=3886 RepID=A0AAN9LIW2_PHACN